VEEIMQNLYQLQDQMILIFVIIATVALLSAWVFSRVITRPIAGLNRGIQRMSKGDFSSRVRVRGSGEMKQLAMAFNSMSEKLETLDQSRNQFVSNASHELKTPLATMKIMIESLIYQPDMDRGLRTEFLTDINNEIDRLSAIVSDLLTLVQMDSQNVKLTRENLSIAALIKENAHRLQPIAQQKGQQILLSLSDPCDIYADKSKLNQVIYNLMENAVKYTQNGGVIKVNLQRQGRDARFTVTDNGPGIPKENLPHIFDRFYRVDKARSREKGGTGLGLSIVHQLVLLHGGAINVESEEGRGATFIVELPLHQG
jgi:signal transduction histidine kinase